MKSDGTLDRNKAWLIAQGYEQEYGLDYKKTFAPVAKMMTVCVLLTIAYVKLWQLHQMNVKNAFFSWRTTSGYLHEASSSIQSNST